jgi:hypothetical protein
MILLLLYLWPTAALVIVVAGLAVYNARAARAAQGEISELRQIAGERAETVPFERVDAVVVDDPDVLAENRVVIDAFAAMRSADVAPPEGWQDGVHAEIDKQRR